MGYCLRWMPQKLTNGGRSTLGSGNGLVQSCTKPLPKPMLNRSRSPNCVTRPQWVNTEPSKWSHYTAPGTDYSQYNIPSWLIIMANCGGYHREIMSTASMVDNMQDFSWRSFIIRPLTGGDKTRGWPGTMLAIKLHNIGISWMKVIARSPRWTFNTLSPTGNIKGTKV